LRECWLAHERLRVSKARSINRAEILTARTDAATDAEVAAAEAAAMNAAAVAEAAAAAEAAAKAAAKAPGARAASAPELSKELGGGAGGMETSAPGGVAAPKILPRDFLYCSRSVGIKEVCFV